jgi:hypothetical protein
LLTTGPFKTAVHKMGLPNFAGQQFAIYKLTEKSFLAEVGSCDGQTSCGTEASCGPAVTPAMSRGRLRPPFWLGRMANYAESDSQVIKFSSEPLSTLRIDFSCARTGVPMIGLLLQGIALLILIVVLAGYIGAGLSDRFQ